MQVGEQLSPIVSVTVPYCGLIFMTLSVYTIAFCGIVVVETLDTIVVVVFVVFSALNVATACFEEVIVTEHVSRERGVQPDQDT